jgi:hypothetical protein
MRKSITMFKKLKTYGKRVASGGKWGFWGGVLAVAAGAGLLCSPIGPAVAAGAATAILAGSIVSFSGGGAYLLGKLAYPVTKVFASMKRGPKAFFGEVGRGMAKMVTSGLKIGGTVLIAGAVVTAAVAITAASFGVAAPAAITLSTYGMTTAVSIAGASATALGIGATICGAVGAAGLLLGKVGDKIIGSIPRVKWRSRRRESNIHSGGSRSHPIPPPSQPPLMQSTTENTTRQPDSAVTPNNETPRRPERIPFSQLQPNRLQQLQKHTFEVASNDGNQTVIHKMGDQYREEYLCANGTDCPDSLTPRQKLNLSLSEDGAWSFKPLQVQSREAGQKAARH